MHKQKSKYCVVAACVVVVVIVVAAFVVAVVIVFAISEAAAAERAFGHVWNMRGIRCAAFGQQLANLQTRTNVSLAVYTYSNVSFVAFVSVSGFVRQTKIEF